MNNDTTIEILKLHDYEVRLIKAIRHQWRFGEIEIQVREGLPFRINRVREFIDLTKPIE